MESDKKHHGTGNFVPGSVRIIDFDSTNSNLLVRGSSAFGAGNFTMDAFISAIQSAPSYAQTGITLSSSTPPLIIDFCLIGFGPPNHKDKRIVTAEAHWFSDSAPELDGTSGPYPTLVASTGSGNLMVYWPILAIPSAPTASGGSWSNTQVVNISITAMSDNSGFNFSHLVPTIRAALTNQTGAIAGYTGAIQNAVIYVHCDSGINRTGAAIIAYLMQYGSAVTALGIPCTSAGSYHTLQAAQTAAAVDPPEGDSPVGGVDQAVSEAYCNLLYTGDATSALASACVPQSGTVT